MTLSSQTLALLPRDKTVYGLIRAQSPRAVKWLPLSSLVHDQHVEGVTDDGEWVMQTSDNLVVLTDETVPLLFPVLQLSRDEFISRFDSQLNGEFIQRVVGEFPWCRVLIGALRCGGSWANHALNKLEEIPFPSEEQNELK